MRQLFIGGTNIANLSTSTTEYLQLKSTAPVTDINAGREIFTLGGTISRFMIKLTTAPGSGKSRTFTLFKNGVATDLSVTISGTNTEGSDLVHSVDISADDYTVIRSTVSGSPAASPATYSLVFSNPTANESVCFGSAGTWSGTNLNRWLGIIGAGASDGNTNAQTSIPLNGKLKNLKIVLDNPPGSGNTVTATVLKNGVDTDLEVVLSGSSQTEALNDTDELSVSDGDLIQLRLTRSSTSVSGVILAMSGVTFECDDGDDLFFTVTGTTGGVSNSSTQYRHISGTGTGSTNTTERQQLVQQGFELIRGRFNLSTAPTTGKHFRFLVNRNGNDTSVSDVVSDTNTTNSGLGGDPKGSQHGTANVGLKVETLVPNVRLSTCDINSNSAQTITVRVYKSDGSYGTTGSMLYEKSIALSAGFNTGVELDFLLEDADEYVIYRVGTEQLMRSDAGFPFSDFNLPHIRVLTGILVNDQLFDRYYYFFNLKSDPVPIELEDGDLLQVKSIPYGTPTSGVPRFGYVFRSLMTSLLFSESIDVTDSVVRGTTKEFNHPIEFTEAMVLSIATIFLNGVGVVDSMLRSVGKVFTNPISITDSIFRSVQKVFNESVGITASIIAYILQHLIFIEPVSVVDSMLRNITYIINSSVSVVDSMLRSINKSLTVELPTVIDSIVNTYFIQRVFTTAISVQESVLRSIGKVFTTNLGITDQLTKLRAVFKEFSESISGSDTINYTLAMVFSLSVTFRERLRRWLNGVIILYDSYYKNKNTTYDPYKYTERGNEYSDGYSSKGTEYTKKYRDNE